MEYNMTETNDKIENAMYIIKAEKYARDCNTKSIDEAIAILQAKKDEISKPFDDIISEKIDDIKSEVLSIESSYKGAYGSVRYTRGYVRSSWDNKALRAFAVTYPSVLNFVSETEVKPSVSIKIGE